MKSIARWTPALVVPALAVLAAAPPVSAATSSSLTKADAMVTAAIKATDAAKSLTIVGAGSSSGQTVAVNLTVGPTAAYGVLTYSGQSTTLRRVGSDIYAKGSKGFLEQQGLSASQAGVEANKWFHIPSSDTTDYHDLDHFLTLSGVLSGLVPSAKKEVVTSVKNSTLNGKAVKVMTGTFDGQKGTVYVLAHGTPYLVRVIQTASANGGGTINLSNYNKAVHTSRPAGAVTE